jgi:hypothetical protein
MIQRYRLLWSFALLIPIFIHFFLLQKYLINFPFWADDFTFIQIIKQKNQSSFFEFIPLLFEAHNEIHRIVFSRLLVLLIYFFSGEFSFKTFTILANIQMIGILIPFYLYIKKKAWSLWHLIPISLLLFSGYGNFDNFSLIGALSHTSALLFLVWIAYGLICSKQRIWPIILSLAMPFVSTEGLAMLPLVAFILFQEKHKLTLPFLLLAFIIIYYYPHGAKVEVPAMNLSKFFSIAYGFISFIGISRIPVSDTYRIIICAIQGFSILSFVFILLIKAYRNHQLKEFAFPAIILYLIAATGILICIGRFALGPISLIATSERFNSYGLLPLIAIYLMAIETWGNVKLLFPIIFCYYLASIYFAIPHLELYQNRQKGDLINTYYQNESVNYDIAENSTLLINPIGYYYHYPIDLIPSSPKIINSLKNANVFLEKGVYKYERDKTMHYFNLTHPLFVEKQLNSRYLVMQSKIKINYFLFVPLLNDNNTKNATRIAQCSLSKTIKISDFNFFLVSLNGNQIKQTWKIKI